MQWDIFRVITTTADDRKRVLIPQAKPGQVYTVMANPDGSFTLSPVEATESEPAKFNLVKNADGYTVIETDRHVSMDTIKELLADFR
jgi:hypothetical protein